MSASGYSVVESTPSVSACKSIKSEPLTQRDLVRFDSLFAVWKQKYEEKLKYSSNADSARQLQQYSLFLQMGIKVIPLLVDKLEISDNITLSIIISFKKNHLSII